MLDQLNIRPLPKACYDPVLGATQIGGLGIDDSVVQQLLMSLNKYKSPGPDDLHPTVLKILGKNPNFAASLVNFFRVCVTKRRIPKAWITAVHKKGQTADSYYA